MLKNSHFWKVWLPPHVLGIGGLFMAFNWKTAVMAFVCYTLISGLGVAVGLHRYFSHKAFTTTRFWEQAMLYTGCLACHGNPFFWMALHRGLHHRHSDTEKDPHSPIHGWWTAYQGYAFSIDPKTVPLRAGADFLRRSDWQWSMKHYHKVLWLTWITALVLSVVFGWWIIAGLGLAQIWAIHQEAVVNLLGHTSGFGAYRSHETTDKSVNRNWLGLLTWGQSLHNNHHHLASAANFAMNKGEFDPSMLWIKLIRT